MIRGTAPTFEFTLPFDTVDIAVLHFTMMQGGRIVVGKTLADCTATGRTLSVMLSQMETLDFLTAKPVEMQLRGKMKDGTPFASYVANVSFDRILKGGVI